MNIMTKLAKRSLDLLKGIFIPTIVIGMMIPAIGYSTAVPVQPVLNLPLDAAGNVSTEPTVSWNTASGAVTYNLQVSLNSDCSAPVYDGTLLAGLSQPIPVLSNFTQYYWRVSATNGAGTSAWSLIWSFTTVPTPVNLGAAGSFMILAQTGITGGAAASINGDIGVSPNSATSIVGFNLLLDGSGTFSTSTSVTNGKVYAADYTEPTATNLTSSISDKNAAYGDAFGRTPIPSGTFLDVGTGEIGGLTLVPGLYKWNSGVTISNDVTLSGAANDVWIFQIAGTLDLSATKQVLLGGSASSSNIFWQVSDQVTLGANSAMKGIILGATGIAMQTSGSLDGKAFAGSNVTLDANTIMPVELTTFTATVHHLNTDLYWSTATEVNNYGFDVERKSIGTWDKVAFVNGAGTSNNAKSYSYSDDNLSAGSYSYRLKQIDRNGQFTYSKTVEAVIGQSPGEFALLQNFPNPFNPTTMIGYSLATDARVSLKVYNILGSEVATLVYGQQEAGNHQVVFNANSKTSNLTSGVYFYRLEVHQNDGVQTGSVVSTKKLILMK